MVVRHGANLRGVDADVAQLALADGEKQVAIGGRLLARQGPGVEALRVPANRPAQMTSPRASLLIYAAGVLWAT